MNFRPTRNKVIVSLIVLIVVSIYSSSFVFCRRVDPTGQPVPCYASFGDQLIASFFTTNVIFGLIVFGLVYTIWSLIEKRGKLKTKLKESNN